MNTRYDAMPEDEMPRLRVDSERAMSLRDSAVVSAACRTTPSASRRQDEDVDERAAIR